MGMLISGADACELLFKVQTVGTENIDKLAASIRETSGSAGIAAETLTGLEKSIQALTAAVTENTTALSTQETAFNGAAGGATRLAGGARAATAELRMMEGAMPIRAAGQFLSQIQGLNSVMGMMFPIFGAVALVGVLDTILEKTGLLPKHWDEVAEAQKSSLDMLQKSSKEYDQHLEKLKQIKREQFELANGKDAARALDAFELQLKAGGTDKQAIDRLEKQVESLRFFSTPTTQKATSDQRFYAGLAGLSSAEDDNLAQVRLPWGLNGESFGSRQQAAKELLPGFEAALRAAKGQKEEDEAQSGLDRAKIAADDKKKAQEEATKHQRELAQAEKEAAAYLRQAQNFELTGLARINEVYREKLELLGKTKKAIDDINAAHAIEVQRELTKMEADNRKAMGKVVEENEKDAERSRDFDAKQFLANLKKEIEQESKDIASGLKVLQASDDSDADAVRRALGVTVKGNSLAVKSGRMNGQDAAGNDYDARKAAAEEIFRIETQHLNLIDDKDRREEKLAQARKKYADEIYRAEEQYENDLQSLREKDLQKYQTMAGSIFDAMHSHTMNQWFRGFALGQEKQVFTNAVTPVLQNAGHMLGGLVPNAGPLGTLLHGTIFDSANKGVDNASTTAKETKRTADEVYALRGDIRAMGGAPAPSAGSGGTGGGSDIFNLPSTHSWNPLQWFGSDMNGWTGSGPLGTGSGSTAMPGGSALFNAGNGSGFSQFFSGLSGMGSNPLQAIFSGMSTNGGTVTQLTAAQQAGAAVGTAAMLAGAGMTIASGISQGGVGGYTKAASAGLGAAAMLDPDPLSKTILSSVAAVTSLVGSLFGTGPQQRLKDITNELSRNQYLAPTALNVIQGMNGTYEDFDARGNLRTSSMSAVPTVAEPYITSKVIDGQRQYYDVPGQVTAPYTGGAQGTGQAPIAGGITVNVAGNLQAMDSESFHDFVRKPANSNSVGEAWADHVERHDGRATNAVRFVSGQ